MSSLDNHFGLHDKIYSVSEAIRLQYLCIG